MRLVSVGILEARKNQRLLVRCMQGLHANQARLHLYGIGPQQALLEDMVNDLDISDRVTFEGWVAADQIWPNADLLLLPSLHEGAPNAMLESLSYNVPVLASAIPEHAEILPANQLLPVDDPGTWRNRLEAIVEAPAEQLESLRNAQREVARSLQFDWDSEICRLITGHTNTASG